MGIRKVTVKQSATESIAAIAWDIESKGLVKTAEKFTDDVYDYFVKLGDKKREYAVYRDPGNLFLKNAKQMKIKHQNQNCFR